MSKGVYILLNAPFNLILQSWGFTFCFLCFAYLFYLKTKKMAIIDIFWGVFHFVQAFGALYLLGGKLSWQKWIIFSLIGLWAFRLSVYLFVRSIGKGEDPRYEKLSKDWKGSLELNVFFRIFCGQFLSF